MNTTAIEKMSPKTVHQWVKAEKPLILIDTLSHDHFKAIHLPGAKSACVFEVTFLDQIAAITTDKHTRIVLYGANERTMDAAVAAEKLQRAGFDNLFILDGGINGWRAAGYPAEGESVDMPPPPENLLALKDGTYRVDIDQSVIEWAGHNPNTKHDGTVRIAKGEIGVKDGKPFGTFVIDMNALENKSLAGDELQPVLLSHLKSDDFFFTRLFPTATFTIKSGLPRKDPYLSAPNLDVQGELTLKDVKAELSFPATVYQAHDGTITAKGRFDLDRTRWNIIYGSTRFFEHLGMHLVFDMIHFEVKIVALRNA
ncbi:YceI family protein [uncultured Desulfosarcina sp.]|uniref:YceI family protein n=1 Tax=uncultured Desulfosarcina sp. TaxID=218289 RepID=UPI0029C81897|nr:YceI family protein [uncultured Desulfosarcina sp.]